MYPVFLQILGIFGIIFCGWFMARKGWFNPLFSTDLSRLLISFFYPALIYSSIVRTFDLRQIGDMALLPLGAAGVLMLGWCVGWLAKHFLKREKESTRRCFHFACMMNNYSFLPIMIVAPWGEEWVAMVALSALGSDTLMWSLGFKTLSGRKFHFDDLGKLISPPVVALLAALATLCAVALLRRVGAPEASPALRQLGDTGLDIMYGAGKGTIPVSALICGLRMATTSTRHLFTRLQALTCFLRLALIPALALAVLAFLPIDPAIRKVLSVIALMPVAMSGVSLAEVYGGDAGYMSTTILSTHLVCLVTVPIGLHFILG